MNERGAGTRRHVRDGVPWHVLEGVPAGRAEVPGLLRGLVTVGRRSKAWDRLEERLGWSTCEPLFAHAASRLFELLPDLDDRRLVRVLDFLARRGHSACDSAVGVHYMSFTVFANGGRHVLPLVAHRSAEVRAGAAHVLRTIRCADPDAPGALRQQASVEADPTALASQLLAVGILSGLSPASPGASAAAAAETGAWLRPWLEHDQPLVRLAAAQGTLDTDAAGAPDGAPGTGDAVARTLTAIGTDALPERPWWPTGYAPAERLGRLLAPYPPQAAALVRALAREPRKELREVAVKTAGARLRYWRDPAPDLWETVAAALDEPELAYTALEVFLRGGGAAAPYADRLVGYVERSWIGGPRPRTHNVDTAIRTLVALGEDRALPWYANVRGDSFLRVDHVPERWAPRLLPVLRRQLAAYSQAHDVPEILRTLADWGPAAAAAVPELIGLLDTGHARPAAEALGRIGPAAGGAAGVLAALATTPHTPWAGPLWRGGQSAAWAHWRVTGDPELALRVCGAAVRVGPGRPVLRYLADLGPLATAYADAVRPLMTCPGEWSRVGAAEAWWRITGDATRAVDALLPELAPLADHGFTPLALRTVGVLGAIGRPASAARPTLLAVTSSPRRYGGAVRCDEELTRTARAALAGLDG
ncbi:hypothetical protein ACFWAR_16105 [Streptomyces sp. NPDC059917]|uniref:hypothetical protein n=1 Tax=Streptomyces sp. NPDC059917 TaxID=3347002 RepID=UPI003646BF94